MAAARRKGLGLYTGEWELNGDAETVAESILAWCRETMANCRRPYGIAHFDLLLSCRRAGQKARKLHFVRREPRHLYGDGDLAAQVRSFIASSAAHGPAALVVALSSWGDLAHAALSQ